MTSFSVCSVLSVMALDLLCFLLLFGMFSAHTGWMRKHNAIWTFTQENALQYKINCSYHLFMFDFQISVHFVCT
jgi:hypothetical protein